MALDTTCQNCGNAWTVCVCNAGAVAGHSNLPGVHHHHGTASLGGHTHSIPNSPLPDRWFDHYLEMMKRLEQERLAAGILDMKQDDTTKENKLLDMIASRLHLPRLKLPFQRIHAHEGTDNVSVWIVVNDQAVTIADEVALFPSDKLITQLRLLIKKEDE